MATITKIKKNNDDLNMTIQNVDVSFVNAIRRLILSDVETVSFNTDEYLNSDLKIITNTTPLHNEFILHRFGLVPVNIGDIESFDSSKYKFILNKENKSNEIINVTTEDFEVYDTFTNEKLDTTDFFKKDSITGEYILILKLKPNQVTGNGEKIHVEGKCSKSSGRKNARFSPVSVSLYTYTHDPEKFKMAVQEKQLKTTQEITQFKIEEGERYFKTDSNDEPNSFDFKIESVGIIPPNEIFKYALTILAKKLLTFRNNVNNIIVENDVNDEMKIYDSVEKMKGFTIEVDGESHTLGNLLQAYLSLDNRVQFVAYKNPHPLINKIELKLKIVNHEMTLLNEIIKKTVDDLIEIINEFTKIVNTKAK